MYAYPPQEITRRPMTDDERRTVVKSFKGNQKVMMILAPVPIGMFFIILFITNAGDASLLTVFFYLFAILTMVLCVLILAMSVYLFKMRGKAGDVLADGTAIEVRGVAVRNQAEKKAPSYAVGPITVTVKPEDARLIPDGAPVTILCVPRLNIALSANGAELEHGTWVEYPPGLEASAASPQQAAQAQQQAPAQQQYRQAYQQAPQQQQQGQPQGQPPAYQQQAPQQYQQAQQQPAPQQQGVFCPRCNLRNQPGAQYCQSCQAQLPR